MKKSFDEFKEYVKGKRAAVVGIGVSNTPLIKMLVDLGASVMACDKKSDIGEDGAKLKEMGVELELGESYLDRISECDIIFRTPSMRPDNPYLVAAKSKGAVITSEMEQFLKYCPAKVIGVTGSAGKTTTSTLIYKMLETHGYRAFLGGNIGNPLFYRIEEMTDKDFVVVELSSFQLMECKYSPDIALVTNVSPNHLDIHKDMEEYIDAKKSIYKGQDSTGITILNMDNEITFDMKNEPKGEVRFFSMKNNSALAHLEDDMICVGTKNICSMDDVMLPGRHNVQNLLAAICAVSEFVSVEDMRTVALNFKGVEHRLEFVREVDGVKYYNDSIASSPERTIAGLKYFYDQMGKKVILIAGGYDKHLPFDELAEVGVTRIKTLIILGVTKDKIREVFEKQIQEKKINLDIIEVASLEEAVAKAKEVATPGDIVTLSPACASFDMFKNFEVRGKKFKEIVASI